MQEYGGTRRKCEVRTPSLLVRMLLDKLIDRHMRLRYPSLHPSEALHPPLGLDNPLTIALPIPTRGPPPQHNRPLEVDRLEPELMVLLLGLLYGLGHLVHLLLEGGEHLDALAERALHHTHDTARVQRPLEAATGLP